MNGIDSRALTFSNPFQSTPSSSPTLSSKDRFSPHSSSISSSSPPTSHSDFHSPCSRSSSKLHGLNSPEHSELSDLLVPQLEKDAIEFGLVDYTTSSDPLSLDIKRVREELTTQFPALISRPQSTQKSKPNAPSPALNPSPDSISPEEKSARKESLSIHVERQEERSVIKALVVLESRRVSFKKVGKAGENAPLEDLPVMPSPWLISLDVSGILGEGKRKNKKTYELSEFKCNVKCGSCIGSRLIPCVRCSSIEADECFWCDGTGKRKGGKLDGQICNVCQGKSCYQCDLCNNSGKVECQECNLQGVVEMSAFVEVSLRSVELPAIPLAALFNDELPGDSLLTAYEVRSVAIDRVLSSIQKLCRSTNTEVAPVMARCFWERSTVSTIEVIKPLLKWKGKDGLEDSTSFTETETHYFNISSNPSSKPQEVHSRPGSRINSGNVSRSGTALVSPNSSVSDLHLELSSTSISSKSIERRSSHSESEGPKIKKQKSMSKIFGGFKARSKATSTSNSTGSGTFSTSKSAPEFYPQSFRMESIDAWKANTSAPFPTTVSAPGDLASKSSMIGLSNIFMEPSSSDLPSGLVAAASESS